MVLHLQNYRNSNKTALFGGVQHRFPDLHKHMKKVKQGAGRNTKAIAFTGEPTLLIVL